VADTNLPKPKVRTSSRANHEDDDDEDDDDDGNGTVPRAVPILPSLNGDNDDVDDEVRNYIQMRCKLTTTKTTTTTAKKTTTTTARTVACGQRQ